MIFFTRRSPTYFHATYLLGNSYGPHCGNSYYYQTEFREMCAYSYRALHNSLQFCYQKHSCGCVWLWRGVTDRHDQTSSCSTSSRSWLGDFWAFETHFCHQMQIHTPCYELCHIYTYFCILVWLIVEAHHHYNVHQLHSKYYHVMSYAITNNHSFWTNPQHAGLDAPAMAKLVDWLHLSHAYTTMDWQVQLISPGYDMLA